MLSIDIGIKNMAYCFMNAETKQILKWGVLDLNASPSPTVSLTDSATFVKCSFCKVKAYASFRNVIYCKRHLNLNVEKPLMIHKELECLKVKELEEIGRNVLKDFKKCTKTELITSIKASPLYTQLYCIALNSKEEKKKNVSSTSTVSLITLGRNLKTQLDALHFDNLETVIIENQVSPIASRMKTLQGMVAQYFVDCYTHLKTIEFVSSQNKLKGFLNTSEQKLNYKERKAKGVEICRQLLQEQEKQMVDIFNLSSKKDDLADSFLQGYCYKKV
jgi:hypothetical protein